jgi:hypothetical protein
MKSYIFIIVGLFCELAVFSQANYLNTQFIQDKKALEKAAYGKLEKMYSPHAHFTKSWEEAAYQRLKENGIYKKEDSLRVIFIYRFQEFDLDTVEINNNCYLSKIMPCYTYSNYLLFPVFRTKFPLHKRLCANGYLINKDNELVATITSTNGYPFYITSFSYSRSYDNKDLIQRDNEHRNLTNNLLTQDYDLCFYLGLTGGNTIWCVKDNETWIYDIKQQKFFTLSKYHNCCWEYHRVEDILGLPK